MTLYWLYRLPLWISGAVIVAVFAAFGLAGLYATRRWVRRLGEGDPGYNQVVGSYLSGVTVLYAICVGLLAIGAWATYRETQEKVDHEAAALGALYRDVGAYPEPARSILQDDLRRYTRAVIDVGWPMQQRGEVPNNASPVLNDFQAHLLSFEPKGEREDVLAAEAYRAFNDLTESRRVRLNSATAELPGPLWALVMLGAAICTAATWFLYAESFAMRFWMTLSFTSLLGLLIFLVAVLDNPYRGQLSVSPEPLERVYTQIMAAPQ